MLLCIKIVHTSVEIWRDIFSAGLALNKQQITPNQNPLAQSTPRVAQDPGERSFH